MRPGLRATLKAFSQRLSKYCWGELDGIRMPRYPIAIVVLACLVWGLSKPAAACDHGGAAESRPTYTVAGAPVAQVAIAQEAPVAQAAPELPLNKCLGTCPEACCCHGGMASCSTGHAPGQASSGFELCRAAARGARLAWRGEQTVPYREPLYGLDRPPKA